MLVTINRLRARCGLRARVELFATFAVIQQQLARSERAAVHSFEFRHLGDQFISTELVDETERSASHGWEAETEHSTDISFSLYHQRQIKKKKRNSFLPCPSLKKKSDS